MSEPVDEKIVLRTYQELVCEIPRKPQSREDGLIKRLKEVAVFLWNFIFN